MTDTQAETTTDLENTIFMDTEHGRIVIEMRPDLAPNHVSRIKKLVREGFYDGIVFHRVIGGFMAQTGDPTGTGRHGSGQKINAEFSKEPHVRGTLSMARAQDENSADSQFFIVFSRAAHLDEKYTVWGKVTSGMSVVGKIKRGDSRSGVVNNPDSIIRMQIAADIKK
jgi:peptidylprolyl isomerase